ncbi:MAG TPA: hypothetical protein VLS49_05400 [Usitatibacter sp.]|nr:hypothetical protein [Usitatibacter sp.]
MTRRLAALLLALLPVAAQSADLGRLFYTPAERERLDRLRRGETTQEAAAAPSGIAHSVTGYVERSDGRGVVWIDGRPVVVSGPGARRVFDPRAVNAYSRSAGEVKIERER